MRRNIVWDSAPETIILAKASEKKASATIADVGIPDGKKKKGERGRKKKERGNPDRAS